MVLDEVMALLRSRGKPATAEVYRRQGVHDETLGVSYGDLGAIVKQVKVDHELALQLWATGIHDARVLATKIVDPAQLRKADIEGWLEGQNNYVIVDAISTVAARMPDARAIAGAWIDREDEWLSSAGWSVIAHLAMAGRIDAADGSPLVTRIQKGIHGAQNRTRYSMNNALIAIGSAIAGVRDVALEAAQKIGKVLVDHGETGCLTPDAAEYIKKTVARAAEVAARGPGAPTFRRTGRPVRPMSMTRSPMSEGDGGGGDDGGGGGGGPDDDDGPPRPAPVKPIVFAKPDVKAEVKAEAKPAEAAATKPAKPIEVPKVVPAAPKSKPAAAAAKAAKPTKPAKPAKSTKTTKSSSSKPAAKPARRR